MTRFVLPLVCLTFALSSAGAQESDKKYTVRWFGQSFFQVETPAGKKVVFDPHAIPEFGRHLVQADIILCSHLHTDHTQTEIIENHKAARIFQGLKVVKKDKPADWNRIDEKVGAIRLRTVATYHDVEEGMQRGKNAVFVVETDGMTFCHLGDLGHELSDAQVKAIGPVDVLMIPVGGIYTVNGENAKKVMAQIKPKLFVLPMHYGVPGYDDLLSADEFLDGQDKVKKLPNTNELVIPADAKADAPTVVLLGYKKEDAPAPPKK